MKLIYAIVNSEDSNKLSSALTKNGHYTTKLASTGGFLKAGNTTFICATEDDQVDAVISIIRDTCKTRKQLLFTPDSYGNGMPNPMPIEVEVGGATIFVTNIEHMEKV